MRGAIRSRNLIHDLAGTRLTPPGAVNDFNDTGVEYNRPSIISALNVLPV